VLLCRGDEDRSTQSLRRGPLSRALRGEDHVTVDLSELVFADSSLMLDLVMLAQRLRKRELIMRMRGAQPQIQRLIQLLGVHRLPGVAVDGLDPGLATTPLAWRLSARRPRAPSRRRDRRS
jgi:anti-anti-sigma regulatory factor